MFSKSSEVKKVISPKPPLATVGFGKLDSKKEDKHSIKRIDGQYDYRVRIGILGDNDTGKISLSAALAGNKYDDNDRRKHFCDYISSDTQLDDKIFNLQIKTLSNNRFNTPIYNCNKFKNVHLFFITFDLANRESFQNLNKYVEDIERYGDVKAIFFLVGTKLDKVKPGSPVISDDEIIKFTNGLGTNCIGISKVNAKEGTNVRIILEMALSAYLRQIQEIELKRPTSKFQEQKSSLLTEREILDQIWRSDSLIDRNKLICKWLEDKSNNLKNKEWNLIRADSLKKLFSDIEKVPSFVNKKNMLSGAINLSLFNKHRKGWFGDTGSVSKIKKEIEKISLDVEIENARSNAQRQKQ